MLDEAKCPSPPPPNSWISYIHCCDKILHKSQQLKDAGCCDKEIVGEDAWGSWSQRVGDQKHEEMNSGVQL